jgi:formate hydrogenlyase transcriptional activator
MDSIRNLSRIAMKEVSPIRSALYIPVAELEIEEEDIGHLLESSTHEAAERDHILRALRDAKGLIAGAGGAAARLGLKRTTLNSTIGKLGIERSDYI